MVCAASYRGKRLGFACRVRAEQAAAAQTLRAPAPRCSASGFFSPPIPEVKTPHVTQPNTFQSSLPQSCAPSHTHPLVPLWRIEAPAEPPAVPLAPVTCQLWPSPGHPTPQDPPPEMCRLPPPPQAHPSLAGLWGDYTTLPADGITSTSCPLLPESTTQLPAPTPPWQRNGAEQTPNGTEKGVLESPRAVSTAAATYPQGYPGTVGSQPLTQVPAPCRYRAWQGWQRGCGCPQRGAKRSPQGRGEVPVALPLAPNPQDVGQKAANLCRAGLSLPLLSLPIAA